MDIYFKKFRMICQVMKTGEISTLIQFQLSWFLPDSAHKSESWDHQRIHNNKKGTGNYVVNGISGKLTAEIKKSINPFLKLLKEYGQNREERKKKFSFRKAEQSQ